MVSARLIPSPSRQLICLTPLVRTFRRVLSSSSRILVPAARPAQALLVRLHPLAPTPPSRRPARVVSAPLEDWAVRLRVVLAPLEVLVAPALAAADSVRLEAPPPVVLAP